ncbi:MAG: hypothetical protein ACRDRL_32110, partial [Sciscionella sp.]
WMAAPAIALSGLLGGGFGAGVGLAARKLIGSGQALRLPRGYTYITLLWGVAALLCLAGVALLGLSALADRLLADRRGHGAPAEIGLLHTNPADAARAAKAWWWAGWERRHLHQAVLALTAALSVGTALSVVLRLSQPPRALPSWTAPLSGFGVLMLGFLAVALLRSVYLAARKPSAARHLGSIADLASFWPRETHPIVPPCYALKAIPEIAARAAEYLKDGNTRVVLSAHSQGSVLMLAAAGALLETLSETERERLGVLVSGAPLQWAYPRAFPAVVPVSALSALYAGLDGRLRALCRGTDPFGGAVTTWQRQVFDDELVGLGYRTEGGPGALAAASVGPSGALVLGGDHWLPDPQHGPVTGRRWSPGINAHTDYQGDPEWDRAVAMAAGLLPANATPSQAMLFPLPGFGTRAH